jgi:chemotaxis protein MotB
MKRSAGRSFPLLLRETLALALLVVALAAGCVSIGAHREVVRERDQYRQESERRGNRIELLEASNTSLSEERVALIDEIEDLRQTREVLEEKVDVLDHERGELETNLRRRESEVARRAEEVEQLRQTYEGLVDDLESEVAAGRIEIDRLREGLRLNLSQEILFGSGSARLNRQGRAVIAKVAGRLATISQRIEVQGHTDSVAIAGALAGRYPSNWELAGARAASVVRLLGEFGVPPERMSAVSFGQFRPVASNDTSQGRARNRRIEIRLLPAEGPAPADPPASE